VDAAKEQAGRCVSRPERGDLSAWRAMLSVYKNNVVSGAALSQADVRQRELDFYTNNYWTWGSTAVIMAGFAFAELNEEIPEDTHPVLACAFLACSATCLGLDLLLIIWTVLICTWGPGNALRGPQGMKSFHDTIQFMKDEQMQFYWLFVLSVVAYFGSTCCLLWVYPSDTVCNIACTAILLLTFVVIAITQCRLEFRVGSMGNAHEDIDGRIKGFQTLEDVADLDTFVSAAVPENAQATMYQRGMYPG